MIKVSLLIPIYGVEKYIERCVTSLMDQTYQNIEYVFVNDCTKDASIDILQNVISRYPNRKPQVQIINHDYNRGIAAARNTGVEACTGEYFLYVDSDDWITIDAVKKLVDFVTKKDSDIVIFGNYNVYENHQTESKVIYPKKHRYISDVLCHTIPASIWNKFFKTDFYKNLGIRFTEGINHGEDYEVVPRLLHKADKIDVFCESLYFYNLMNRSSYTHNVSLKTIISVHSAFEVVYEYFGQVADKSAYEETLKKLPLRSMLALTKKSSKENYADILNLYSDFVDMDSRYLSKSDRLILCLLKAKQFGVLNSLLKLYKCMK